MTAALYDADPRTHLKIVMTALAAATLVLAIGIGARVATNPVPARPAGGIPAPSRIVPDDATQGIPMSALPVMVQTT